MKSRLIREGNNNNSNSNTIVINLPVDRRRQRRLNNNDEEKKKQRFSISNGGNFGSGGLNNLATSTLQTEYLREAINNLKSPDNNQKLLRIENAINDNDKLLQLQNSIDNNNKSLDQLGNNLLLGWQTVKQLENKVRSLENNDTFDVTRTVDSENFIPSGNASSFFAEPKIKDVSPSILPTPNPLITPSVSPIIPIEQQAVDEQIEKQAVDEPMEEKQADELIEKQADDSELIDIPENLQTIAKKVADGKFTNRSNQEKQNFRDLYKLLLNKNVGLTIKPRDQKTLRQVLKSNYGYK